MSRTRSLTLLILPLIHSSLFLNLGAQSMTTGFNVEAEKMNAYDAYSLSVNNFKDYITKNTTENYIPDSESLCVLAWSVNED